MLMYSLISQFPVIFDPFSTTQTRKAALVKLEAAGTTSLTCAHPRLPRAHLNPRSDILLYTNDDADTQEFLGRF